MSEENKIPPCPLCGKKFDNVFDATDHLLEDGEEFDPSLILPGGARLMVGSLLRLLYNSADNKKMVQDIVQSTYMTLFAAETQMEVVGGIVEDMVVATSMMDLDNELKKLLKAGE